MAIANLAMATGNVGREGGREPLRGQNNVQGSCDMGSFPHELPGYRHLRRRCARAVRARLGRDHPARARPAHPHMFEAALGGTLKGCTARARTSCSPTRTRNTWPQLAAMECIVVQDLFLNETAKYAHVFLPGSSFLEKDSFPTPSCPATATSPTTLRARCSSATGA